MVSFSLAMLQAVADFLATPPIFYLFCLVCFVPIIKIVRSLLKFR
jgi:low affinity Fe/Cu permease